MDAVINHYGHQPVSNASLRGVPETQIASGTTAQRTPKWDISQVHPLCQYIFSTSGSVGENKHIEEFNISQLPDLCLQRIFSFCSPFDFPSLHITCRRFANNSENAVVQRALITTTADNLQKMSFFEKLQNNDNTGRKGMAFAAAIDHLGNIPGSSMLRKLDNYQIAIGNVIEQINWLFKPKHEITRNSQQPVRFENLVSKLMVYHTCRHPERRKSSQQWLAQIHLVDGWEALHKIPNRAHVDRVKNLLTDYIYEHPANDWHQLALVSILKTLHKINAKTSGGKNSEALKQNLEEAIATTIYAILEAPLQQDVRDLAETLEALYDTPVEPQWKTSLELAKEVLLFALYDNKALRNKSCSGKVLAAVLKTLLKYPFEHTCLLRNAIAITIFAIRSNPNTKTWDRQTLAAVLKELLKTKPDLLGSRNVELPKCRALIIHDIKTQVPDWYTLILSTLINIAGFETADTEAEEIDLSEQNPKIAKAHQISAIRQLSAQQTPHGQPAFPNHWQDGLVLAAGLEALLAMTVETATNPICQDDWEMAIKGFIAAIRYTVNNDTSSIILVAVLEALNKIPVNSRWAEDREQTTVMIIDAIRKSHISTKWNGEDFARVLQAFNKINTPLSQSLETSLVNARNGTLTLICTYADFSVGDNVVHSIDNFIARMGCFTMPAVLDALFSTPAELPWRQNLAEAKLAVLKGVQFCVDTAPDYSDSVKAALMALKVVEAVPVPEEQELADARALFIESARKRLPQSSENCQYQSEES